MNQSTTVTKGRHGCGGRSSITNYIAMYVHKVYTYMYIHCHGVVCIIVHVYSIYIRSQFMGKYTEY